MLLSVVELPEVVEYLSKPDDFMQAKPRDRQLGNEVFQGLLHTTLKVI